MNFIQLVTTIHKLFFSSVESNRGTTQQSAASSKDGRTSRTKRKANPDKKTPRKRTRLSESEHQNIPEEDLRVRVLKRKAREAGEGPSNQKKRRGFDLNSSSSSVDRGRLIITEHEI